MSESVSAAIYIQGATLHYAEIEHSESFRTLRRVGQKTFNVDVSYILREKDTEPSAFDRVAAFINEGLDGTDASKLTVALQPQEGFSFFTPISAELSVPERRRELVQQTALVTGARSPGSLHLDSQTVRMAQDSDGESHMWVHVLALPDAMETHMAALVDEGPLRHHTWMVSSEGVSRLMGQIERTEAPHEEALQPYSLAIGQYPTHTEFALSRNREWYHSHYVLDVQSPQDRAYYAVGFLNRIDVPASSIGRLYVYGSSVEQGAYEPFEEIFSCTPEILDPSHVVRSGEELSLHGEPTPYVPCIGAGLAPYVE